MEDLQIICLINLVKKDQNKLQKKVKKYAEKIKSKSFIKLQVSANCQVNFSANSIQESAIDH